MKHILLCLALVSTAFVASCKKAEEAPKAEAKPAEAAEKAPEAAK